MLGTSMSEIFLKEDAHLTSAFTLGLLCPGHSRRSGQSCPTRSSGSSRLLSLRCTSEKLRNLFVPHDIRLYNAATSMRSDLKFGGPDHKA